MVSIAVIAIMFGATTFTLFEFRAIQRQKQFQESLRQSPHDFNALRHAQFDSLPPQVKTIEADSTASLAQRDILPDSLVVHETKTGEELKVVEFSTESGVLELEDAASGKQVTINYEFYLPTTNVTVFTNSEALAELETSGTPDVQAVHLAEGDTLREITDFTVEGTTIKLPSHAAERLIVVDYRSSRPANKVSGSFLDSKLQPTSLPTSTKLLQVQESYRGNFRVSLPILKESGGGA